MQRLADFGLIVCCSAKWYNLTGSIRFWEALSQTEYAAAPFPINLITEEDAPPGLKDKIRAEGVPL
jgi:hypothetical protein